MHVIPFFSRIVLRAQRLDDGAPNAAYRAT
jgi:hypothetical protein